MQGIIRMYAGQGPYKHANFQTLSPKTLPPTPTNKFEYQCCEEEPNSSYLHRALVFNTGVHGFEFHHSMGIRRHSESAVISKHRSH